jgi:hypothetical protein
VTVRVRTVDDRSIRQLAISARGHLNRAATVTRILADSDRSRYVDAVDLSKTAAQCIECAHADLSKLINAVMTVDDLLEKEPLDVVAARKRISD